MDPVVVTYLVYVALSVGLTVWVGRVLSRYGAVFLVDVFAGRRDLAEATNTLLVVGFYLLNLGYVAFALRWGGTDVVDGRTAVEALSRRIGGVLLVLGVLHLGNVVVLSRLRRRHRLEAAPRPPVSPATVLP